MGVGGNEAKEAVHPELKTVIELQQVDLKIAELTLQIDASPSQIQTLETQLSDFLHAHEERKARLSANQKERRELEGYVKVGDVLSLLHLKAKKSLKP